MQNLEPIGEQQERVLTPEERAELDHMDKEMIKWRKEMEVGKRANAERIRHHFQRKFDQLLCFVPSPPADLVQQLNSLIAELIPIHCAEEGDIIADSRAEEVHSALLEGFQQLVSWPTSDCSFQITTSWWEEVEEGRKPTN